MAARSATYERDRAARLLRIYGITPEEYDTIKAVQDGVCPLCRRARGLSTPLQVDHDHEREADGVPMRGTIRGLLCGRCNNRLGWYEAKTDRVLAYLTDPPAHRVLR